MGTVDENSQNVITNTPPADVSMSSIVDEQSAAVAQINLDVDEEDHAMAQPLQQQQQQHHHGSGGPEAAMKKSFMRKKEMTAVDDGGQKKQKSKVSNTRK